MVDPYTWYGSQTPGAKYDKSFVLTSPKSRHCTIYKPKSSMLSWKIPKEDGPGPGSYDFI